MSALCISTKSDRLRWMFETQAWSDLTIEAGFQCARTFKVHKAVICRELQVAFDGCTTNDGVSVRANPNQSTLHISENPEAVETLLRYIYGFHDPCLQLKTYRNLGDVPVKDHFRLLWDLRLLCRQFNFKPLEDITTLLIVEYYIVYYRFDDLDEMKNVVFRSEHQDDIIRRHLAIWETDPFPDYAASFAQRMAAEPNDPYLRARNNNIGSQDRWADERHEIKERIRNSDELSWLLDGIGD